MDVEMKQEDNTAIKISLDQQIKSIQRELDSNFSLSKAQVMEKKRLMSKLIAEKNKLN